MDLRARRSLLSSTPNPDRLLDYVCSLGSPVDTNIADYAIQFRVRYVPDRVILCRDSLNDYLSQTGCLSWLSLEEYAVTILNDINDELIARWIEVTLSLEVEGHIHEVKLEERQPDWEDQGILARLPIS